MPLDTGAAYTAAQVKGSTVGADTPWRTHFAGVRKEIHRSRTRVHGQVLPSGPENLAGWLNDYRFIRLRAV